MKILIALFLLLGSSLILSAQGYVPVLHNPRPGAGGSWSCAQGATGCTNTTTRTCTGSTTSCNITVAATGAGHTGVACFTTANSTATFTASGAGTWTTATGSLATETTIGLMSECAYNTNLTGGITTITCTSSKSGSSYGCAFFEFVAPSAVTFDSTGVGVVNNGASCTTCASPTLTFGNSNKHVVVQASTPFNGMNAIDQSYTFVADGSSDGYAFKMNLTSPGTTPNWTQSSAGVYCASAISLYF